MVIASKNSWNSQNQDDNFFSRPRPKLYLFVLEASRDHDLGPEHYEYITDWLTCYWCNVHSCYHAHQPLYRPMTSFIRHDFRFSFSSEIPYRHHHPQQQIAAATSALLARLRRANDGANDGEHQSVSHAVPPTAAAAAACPCLAPRLVIIRQFSSICISTCIWNGFSSLYLWRTPVRHWSYTN